jgi:hypothetical protein
VLSAWVRKETRHQGLTAEKCTAQLADLKQRKICELEMQILLPPLLLGIICASSAKLLSSVLLGITWCQVFCSKTVQYEHGLATLFTWALSLPNCGSMQERFRSRQTQRRCFSRYHGFRIYWSCSNSVTFHCALLGASYCHTRGVEMQNWGMNVNTKNVQLSK